MQRVLAHPEMGGFAEAEISDWLSERSDRPKFSAESIQNETDARPHKVCEVETFSIFASS